MILHRCQTTAANPAAVVDNATTALGGHARTETVLPDTADFGRLILAFHKIGGAPEGAEPCKVSRTRPSSSTSAGKMDTKVRFLMTGSLADLSGCRKIRLFQCTRHPFRQSLPVIGVGNTLSFDWIGQIPALDEYGRT